jgi:hypothetical protein
LPLILSSSFMGLRRRSCVLELLAWARWPRRALALPLRR